MLAEIDAYVRDKDPRVRQVTVSLAATWQVVEIRGPTARATATFALGARQYFGVAGQGDRQEAAARAMAREGFARFIEAKAWREPPTARSREALVNLESVPAPPVEMDVVLGAGWPGVCCTRPSATASKAISTASRLSASPA